MRDGPDRKLALVTGASRGIGKSLAIGLAKFGFDVAVTDLPIQSSPLAATADDIRRAGCRAFAYEMDVSSKKAVTATIAALHGDIGHIDVLVNNAGILSPSTLEDLDEPTWNAHFNVNAKGVWLMCQAVIPYMRKQGHGRIINISSLAARRGVATQGHYAATKAAVIALTRVLAQELGRDGITVNAICPGIVLTEMGSKNLGSDEAVRYWEEAIALKRLGQPDDIVGPTCFFASDMSNFVTGQALNVCGGLDFS